MTATLTTPVEALLREQVANGHFPSLDRALEAAMNAVDGRRASHALESLLDEALSPPGKCGPLPAIAPKDGMKQVVSRERFWPPARRKRPRSAGGDQRAREDPEEAAQ